MMNPDAFSRRRMLGAADPAAPPPAEAYQGNMERALSALSTAKEPLKAARPNKGGHRERLERAAYEAQAGIDFTQAHGGGRY